MKPLLLSLVLSATVLAQAVTVGPAVIAPNLFGNGLDDAISGGRWTQAASNHQFKACITVAATPDKFSWNKDGGTFSADISISGAPQALSDGVSIAWAATTGHDVGNCWWIDVSGNGSSAASTYMPRGPGARMRSVQDAMRWHVTAADYGAKGDGIHDDAPAINACIRFASSLGMDCYIDQPGKYKLGESLLLPETHNDQIVGGLIGINNYGTLNLDDIPDPGSLLATVLQCAPVTTCIVGVTGRDGIPGGASYRLEELIVVGSGSDSGDGLVVCCKTDSAGHQMFQKKVLWARFKGADKWAMKLDGDEDGSMIDVSVGSSTNGMLLSTESNANAFYNFSCQNGLSGGDCVRMVQSSGNNFHGGLFQGNHGAGLRIHGCINCSILGTWFENNDEGAIIFDSTAGQYNQYVLMSNLRLGGHTDQVKTVSDGSANSAYIQLNNTRANTVTRPIVSMDAYTIGWRILDSIGGCENIEDHGVRNVLQLASSISNCNGYPSAEFGGPVEIMSDDPGCPPICNGEGIKLLSKYDGHESGTYSYLRTFWNGGGQGPVLGGRYLTGPEVDLLSTNTRYPSVDVGGTLRLKSYAYTDIATFDGTQAFDGSEFYCDDCTPTPTCSGGGGGAYARMQGGTAFCGSDLSSIPSHVAINQPGVTATAPVDIMSDDPGCPPTCSGAEGVKIRSKYSGSDSGTYSYVRHFYNAGAAEVVLGSQWTSGPDVDLITGHARYPAVQVGGTLVKKTYHYADIAAFNGAQAFDGSEFYCDDCTPTPTCSGGGGGAYARMQYLSAHCAPDIGTTGVSAGTYGDAANVAQFAVGADGRVTSASNVLVNGGATGTETFSASCSFSPTTDTACKTVSGGACTASITVVTGGSVACSISPSSLTFSKGFKQ